MQNVSDKFDLNAVRQETVKQHYVSDCMESYMEYVKVESQKTESPFKD